MMQVIYLMKPSRFGFLLEFSIVLALASFNQQLAFDTLVPYDKNFNLYSTNNLIALLTDNQIGCGWVLLLGGIYFK